MTSISLQIKAARDAGYIVQKISTGYNFRDPGGVTSRGSYADEIDAWAAAAEQFKKNKKSLVADKFVVLGRSAGRHSSSLRTDPNLWAVATITHETPTLVHVEGKGVGYYGKKRDKKEILLRFASLEAAEAFKLSAIEAITVQAKAVEDAKVAYEAACVALNQRRRERDEAVKVWVAENVKVGN